MCHQIATTDSPEHKQFTKRTVVYKRVNPKNDHFTNIYSRYGTKRYRLGQNANIPKGAETSNGRDSVHGIYVYRTLTGARAAPWDGRVILKCEVKPKDLLTVSKSGWAATYRTVKPVAVVR